MTCKPDGQDMRTVNLILDEPCTLYTFAVMEDEEETMTDQMSAERQLIIALTAASMLVLTVWAIFWYVSSHSF